MSKVLTTIFMLMLYPNSHLLAQDRFNGVRTSINSWIKEEGIPAVSVAVAQHGKIIWEQGFGWADREKHIAVTQHTMYSLAQLSKPITATGLMTLVESGKVDLDKPMNDYLGEAKLRARIGNARDATVLRVANHSSGLPVHYDAFLGDKELPGPSMQETIFRYGNLVTPPGEHLQSSALGYEILAYVCSRVSGKSYAKFLEDSVFDKLGMTHTSLGIRSRDRALYAVGYDDSNTPIPVYDLDHPGAFGIYSSAHDLARFGMFHLKDNLRDQKQILSSHTIDQMQRPTMSEGTHEGVGIGWAIAERPDGYRMIYHGANLYGADAFFVLVPAEDTVVVVLANKQRATDRIANLILKVLFPRWNPSSDESTATESESDAGKYFSGTWKGSLSTYRGSKPVVLRFLPGGDVHLRIGDQLESILNNIRVRDGWISGEAFGEMDTEEAQRQATNVLRVHLKLRGETLSGGITAETTRPFPVELTQWLELQKQ